MSKQKLIGLDQRFVQRISDQLGAETPEFLAALESESPTSVLLNPMKDPGDIFSNAHPVPWCTAGRYLDQRPEFTFDPLFHAGCYYVMEPSSMFLHHVISSLISKDKPIYALDLCGAPGGKSAVALSCMPKGSVLVSNEVNKARFQTLQYNIDKWGAPNVIRTSLDPTRIPWSGLFDLIIIDAPCSGEGLFRKDKEARTEWNPANVVHCSARQRRILNEAERLLAPDGLLIYSTCTYNDDENMHQVRWMSEQFSLTSVALPINVDWNITTLANEQGTGYQFYPHKVRGEGFFCAVMKKSGDSRSPLVILSERSKSKEAPSKRGSREHNSIIVESNPPKSLINWIKPDDLNGSYRFFESIDKEIYVLQSSIDHDWLSYGIVRYPGTEVGHIKSDSGLRKRSLTFSPSHHLTFLPSHALALSQCLNTEIPSIELDLDQAIRYLRKDSISAESDVPGWNVARYRGFGLGWLKQTQAGLKNYLPTKYRIVKQQVR